MKVVAILKLKRYGTEIRNPINILISMSLLSILSIIEEGVLNLQIIIFFILVLLPLRYSLILILFPFYPL